MPYRDESSPRALPFLCLDHGPFEEDPGACPTCGKPLFDLQDDDDLALLRQGLASRPKLPKLVLARLGLELSFLVLLLGYISGVGLAAAGGALFAGGAYLLHRRRKALPPGEAYARRLLGE